MTMEEELIALREENKALREQLAQRDELIAQQQAVLAEQTAVRQQHAEQMSRLSEQVKSLRERLAKDSHHSHRPPSSDRFARKRKSLRPKSEKPSGGQPGHPGASLPFSIGIKLREERKTTRGSMCHHEEKLFTSQS